MSGFEFMSMVSRIEHYEQIARKMARGRRPSELAEKTPVKLAMAGRPGDPVRLPDEKSA